MISAILGQNSNVPTDVAFSNTTSFCSSNDIDAVLQSIIELKARLNILEAHLSCISNCSVSEVTNSTVIPPALEYEEKIYQNLAILDNWILVYDQPYNHPTSTADLQNAMSICKNQVIVGARRNATDLQLTLAAIGPVEVLQHETAQNTPVKFGDVYWYKTPRQSFGFSPNNTIIQDQADAANQSPELRLSWHLDRNLGGYRAGTATGLNNDATWRKVIYCLN